MSLTWIDVVVWLVVGALAGSLTGLVVKRKKAGFGAFANLAIGLVGALIGGVLFQLLRIDLGLGELSVSLQDLLAAFVGSLIFLLLVRLIRKRIS